MDFNLYILGALLILLVITELLRRGMIREKYASVWFAISAVLLISSIWPKPIFILSKYLGFQAPSNFIFSTLILLLFVLVIQLSVALGRLEDRTQDLAEEIALINLKIKKTQK